MGDLHVEYRITPDTKSLKFIARSAGKYAKSYCLSKREFEMQEGGKDISTSSRIGCVLSFPPSQWQILHDEMSTNALSVTKLVKYMGFGYDPAYTIGSGKPIQISAHLDRILKHGSTMEILAKKVLRVYRGFHDYEFMVDWENRHTIYSGWDMDVIGDATNRKSQDIGLLCVEGCYPLFASPDYIGMRTSPLNDDIVYAQVIEIKSPVYSVCLAGIDDSRIDELFKQQNRYGSNQTRNLRKFLGHVIQTVVYAWLLEKTNMEDYFKTTNESFENKKIEVEDTAELVYFYPDIAANRYMFIIYEIYWREFVSDDEDNDVFLDETEPKWHLEDIIQEYYDEYLTKTTKEQRMAFRNGSYPLSIRAQTMIEDKLQSVCFQNMLSRGIKRARVRVVGGENTKEITWCELGRYSQEQIEKTSLES